MEFAGKAEGDAVGGVDGEISVALGLVAEERVPGFVGGDVRRLDRGEEGIEEAQEGGALGVTGEDGLDVLGVAEPVGLEVAVAIEDANGFAEVQDFVGEPVTHAALPGALVRAAPALRLRVPATAEMARGARLRSAA